MAKLCNHVADGYSKSLDKVRQKLVADNDATVLQYITINVAGNKFEKDRRFLALNYGDDSKNDETDKEITEDEWLAKEKKEIEEVEKTVSIRFANYSTLMRAQTLTQGLSAQLAMFLQTMGTAPSKDKALDDTEFSKKLLEKAGIKVDSINVTNNKRSLSPLGDFEDDDILKGSKIKDETDENKI